jgi:hypothetical protein
MVLDIFVFVSVVFLVVLLGTQLSKAELELRSRVNFSERNSAPEVHPRELEPREFHGDGNDFTPMYCAMLSSCFSIWNDIMRQTCCMMTSWCNEWWHQDGLYQVWWCHDTKCDDVMTCCECQRYNAVRDDIKVYCMTMNDDYNYFELLMHLFCRRCKYYLYLT